MAAGRYGGYRDKELRERDNEAKFTKRRDFYYSKEDNGRIPVDERDGERNREQNKEVEGREKFRVRQKDIKEREMTNGRYNSNSSGSSGSGSRRGGRVSVRTVDKEPGELSSGDESDKDHVLSKVGNGVQPLLDKKRKFSPIVWDREDKGGNNVSRSLNTKTNSPLLPPPPPLPKTSRQLPNIISNGVSRPSPLPPNPLVTPGSVGSTLSESPVDISSFSPMELSYDKDKEPEQLEPGQLEEEEFVSSRHISSSRWADTNSPRDAGEASEDEDILKRRKKMPAFTKLKKKTSSPELGELTREGLEENRTKSLESASEDEYLEKVLEKSSYMDINEEVEDQDVTDRHQTDTESEGEDDFHRIPDQPVPPQRSINMLQGCRSVDEFERLNKIDEGTYGVVYRAKDNNTGEIVALKKVKMEKEKEGFPLTSLREINILLSFHHPSIVDVKEVVVGSNLDSIFMVMEYMEHDLKGLMESMRQPYSQSEVKCLMLQLLEGVKYLHDNWVLHRDLKTSNILLNNRGELKICDFGLSRQYGSPLKPYTHLVVTLWYRAPELLLGAKLYSTAIDMWSLGCIMAELLAKSPLFSGKTEVDQLDKIFRTLGTPSETIWPGFSKLPGVKVNFVKQPYNLLRKKFPATSFTGSPILSDAGFDLLNKLLTYDPEKRITAADALNHHWFREVPLPKSKDFMPTFPAQHATDRRLRRVMKSPDPLEEQRRKELKQREFGSTGLFG
ncbi:hypothetical protein GIB67_009270 [Kingdonia uniflora]|uniref:cyclin-dependent kinase n=1 Tax=Kingdonia uniflora TaxID=39325 RepID=A0A7J7N2G8_9MAGN|nr:hypothetical protein GIB67_009270 [Kingdonia uniflora]